MQENEFLHPKSPSNQVKYPYDMLTEHDICKA